MMCPKILNNITVHSVYYVYVMVDSPIQEIWVLPRCLKSDKLGLYSNLTDLGIALCTRTLYKIERKSN